MRYRQSPVVWCDRCQAPQRHSLDWGCLGCRRRRKEEQERNAGDPATWRPCRRCRTLAPLLSGSPRAICTPCARALRASVKGRTGPRPASAYAEVAPSLKTLARQARAAKRARRAALRRLYPAALAAVSEAKAALTQARIAARTARQVLLAARGARAAALANARQPYTDHAAWAAAQAPLRPLWAQVRTAIQADRAARAALAQARTVSRFAGQHYARVCRGETPVDPTL